MGVTQANIFYEKFSGFRVYKIIPGGPLEKAGLKELEDFIIPPAELFSIERPFYEYIRMNPGKTLKLSVYSLSTRLFSDFEITPGTNEKGQGYLGAIVRYENWSTADKNLLRVLKVSENSIAKKKLGFIPVEDFIIAIRPDDEDILSLNKDDVDPLTYFSEILVNNRYKPVEFFIYNTKNGARYQKAILFGDHAEILGCDVAYGKLHEFPKKYNRNGINEQRERNKLINNNIEQTVDESVNKKEYEDMHEDNSEKDLIVNEDRIEKEEVCNSNINQDNYNIEEDIIVEDVK